MKKATCFKSFHVLIVAFLLPWSGISQTTALSGMGLHVIPYPREVSIGNGTFTINQGLAVIIDKKASSEDRFTAEELVRNLHDEFGISATISAQPVKGAITLSRKGADKRVGVEGYQLTVTPEGLLVKANSGSGLFYGAQTLMQLITKNESVFSIPALNITDWPDIRERAVHYDTKHHQDKKEYVKDFIRDLARYKINMLVWEWEDKLAYTSHPEIGAPGAFTVEEMQEFTKYAKQYHIELVPLVQGLGHVSFILKWPQHAAVREIASSNWEFCPLKDESYALLFDLWDEAVKATPGSRYIHIGSDETYELGMCEMCKAKAAEIGKSGVYTLFVNKAAQHLKKFGREVMAWERPMGWVQNSSPAVGIVPDKTIVLTESYSYEQPDFQFARQARSQGYKVYAYDPNPGIEHIFLPYFHRQNDEGKSIDGSLKESYDFLTSSARSGAFDGMISTSWDDSGLNNQVWMLRFATAAAYSWNGSAPEVNEFADSFFSNYYGAHAENIRELFQLFNEAAYYYMLTFERRVWHWGVIGKTHLPDLPRGDAVEYDPYWNAEYSEMIKRSEEMAPKMERALHIIESNQKRGVKRPHDFEVFQSLAKLVWHTTQTYHDLSIVEQAITEAHSKHFENHELTYQNLEKAAAIVESSLQRREEVFNELVSTWEKTRLPKGMSTADKKYFFQQDRARHFANRVPDMSYHIYDEQKLDMEGWLANLEHYMEYYKKLYLAGE